MLTSLVLYLTNCYGNIAYAFHTGFINASLCVKPNTWLAPQKPCKKYMKQSKFRNISSNFKIPRKVKKP